MSEGVLLDTNYAKAKTYWASDDLAGPREFLLFRQPAPAGDAERIICETCARRGIQTDEDLVPVGDPQRVKLAADEIAGRLRRLGWLDEPVKMRREDCDALHSMDSAHY